jgi:hypothetical protein
MLRSKLLNHPFSIPAVGGLLFILGIAGCGVSKSSSDPTAPTTPPAGPQTYFAPSVSVDGVGLGMSAYTFDDKLDTFSQTIFNNLKTQQPGSQVLDAGHFSVLQRGLRSLSISTTYALDPNNPQAYAPTPFDQIATSSFALELADQAGGFVQLQATGQDQQSVQQPVVPLVAATQCPNLSSAQTYQFITIPGSLIPAGTGPIGAAWDPTTETAYGSVDISSSGSTVNFKNIQQFKLPSVLLPGGGNSGPTQPPSSSITGICGPTNFGNTIVVPGQVVITNPGVPGSGNNTVSPQATIGIGPSGLLVEDNSGSGGGTLAGSSPPLPYDNVLGAGTGAVGLPKPSAVLDTGAVVGAQYLGFIYAAGVYSGSRVSSGWSSHLASFGFSTVPTGCASVAPKTNTLIYGGDFTNDDPSAPAYKDGFGNCNFAINLGNQDSANNGLYPQATVWVGAGYAGNSTGATYSFQAVAIAGQLNGKYAIFLIGEDSTQPWAIYLLQSN